MRDQDLLFIRPGADREKGVIWRRLCKFPKLLTGRCKEVTAELAAKRITEEYRGEMVYSKLMRKKQRK